MVLTHSRFENRSRTTRSRVLQSFALPDEAVELHFILRDTTHNTQPLKHTTTQHNNTTQPHNTTHTTHTDTHAPTHTHQHHSPLLPALLLSLAHAHANAHVHARVFVSVCICIWIRVRVCTCICVSVSVSVSVPSTMVSCVFESSRKPQHSKWNCVGTKRPRHIHMNTPKIRILQKKNFRDDKIRIRICYLIPKNPEIVRIYFRWNSTALSLVRSLDTRTCVSLRWHCKFFPFFVRGGGLGILRSALAPLSWSGEVCTIDASGGGCGVSLRWSVPSSISVRSDRAWRSLYPVWIRSWCRLRVDTLDLSRDARRPLMEFEAGLSFWYPVHRQRAVGIMSTGTRPPELGAPTYGYG